MQECRHTFASLLIDTGANPKAIQKVMGQSKIQTTFDVYGHLLPGSYDDVRARTDASRSAPNWLAPSWITDSSAPISVATPLGWGQFLDPVSASVNAYVAADT